MALLPIILLLLYGVAFYFFVLYEQEFDRKVLMVLCLAIISIGVPLLWHKMSWQPPPFAPASVPFSVITDELGVETWTFPYRPSIAQQAECNVNGPIVVVCIFSQPIEDGSMVVAYTYYRKEDSRMMIVEVVGSGPQQ